MTKWYFYNNKEISDSLNVEEIKQYIQNNPNSYGWNSSLTQWLPINCISEFTAFITTAPKALGGIPKALVDAFQKKKNKLQQMVARLEKEINHTEKSLSDLKTQIERFKKLTLNLSSDLKNNITGMEKQYNIANKKLALLISALDIATTEIDDAITEFSDNTLVDTPIVEKTPNKVAEVVNKETNSKDTSNKISPVKKQVKTDENKVECKSENNDEQLELVDKTRSVKGMLKSVFKTSGEKTAALSISERLKQAEKRNTEESLNKTNTPNTLKVWI